MNYVCARCGKMVPVTTKDANCECGGLWKLQYRPPAFRLEEIDREEWSMFRYRKYMALEDESWRDISLGEGRILHAWDMVRIDDYREIEAMTALSGDRPRYIGWVPIERVLKQKP